MLKQTKQVHYMFKPIANKNYYNKQIYLKVPIYLQVEQIQCGCSTSSAAPDGCLQYYTGISGMHTYIHG